MSATKTPSPVVPVTSGDVALLLDVQGFLDALGTLASEPEDIPYGLVRPAKYLADPLLAVIERYQEGGL